MISIPIPAIKLLVCLPIRAGNALQNGAHSLGFWALGDNAVQHPGSLLAFLTLCQAPEGSQKCGNS